MYHLLLPLTLSLIQSVAGNHELFDRFVKVKEHVNRHSQQRATFQERSSPLFLNENTKKFVVNGTGIPEVNFDVGESYAGLLPIGNDDSRQLYFWFFPSQNPRASNEIAIWLTGGYGCSSLEALLTENGPFLWQDGTLAPTPNPYGWNKLTNFVWVDQPIGTGYTTGKPSIKNQQQLAEQFKGFWRNFVDTFGLQGAKVYLTGESFAGYFVSYIGDSFLKDKDRKTYFNLKGVAMNDPVIGDNALQMETATIPFVDYWNNLLFLNDSFLAQAHKLNDECGYTDYFDRYFTFPAQQAAFPPVPSQQKASCDVTSLVLSAATDINPCFNPYHISDACPFPYSHIGPVNPGDYSPPGAEVYFNRADVKRAINAPVSKHWMECNPAAFAHYTQVVSPAQDGTLTNVIEKTSNVIIGSGALDFVLITNGTFFAVQNLTWNGHRGLKKRPSKPFHIPFHQETNRGAMTGAGTVGVWTSERGLTVYEVHNAGHMLPGQSLGGGYRALELLLGRIDSLSSQAPFP